MVLGFDPELWVRRVEEVAIEEVLEEEAVGILRKSSKKDCRFARSGRAKRA